MTLAMRHWLAALAIAVLIHGGLGYAMLAHAPVSEGAKDKGVGGVELSISMVAAAAGSLSSAAEEQPKPEPVQKEAIPEPRPEPEYEPEPEPAPEPAFEPIKTPEVQTKAQIKPTPKPVAVRESLAPKAEPHPAQPPQHAALRPISQGMVETADLATRTDVQTRAGGGAIAGKVTPSYITALRRWLERHKTYPKTAKRRRQQGVVLLAFTLNRTGQVLTQHIQGSSGHDSLDDETLAMLKRAQPLPPFPKNMDGEIINLILPVEFSLTK